MEDFWAGALWALEIWLYLIISLIMIPAMFGFSLGISETYMTILVKTLEVLLFFIVLFGMLYTTTGNLWSMRVKAVTVSCISSSSSSAVGHAEDAEGKRRQANA